MADVSAMLMNLGLMESALQSAPKVSNAGVDRLNQAAQVQQTADSKEQGVYAVKGDSLYKEEMDANTDGVVTNAEMAEYYAKLVSDYGGEVPTLPSTTNNVVTTSQAANAYMANESTYSAPYTSLIETEA